jgi:hypothetical protein
MIVSLAIVVPGVAVLLIAAGAGMLSGFGRRSTENLVAPRNAEFGETARALRAEATRAQAQADLKALTSRRTDRALVLLIDGAQKQSDQRAA